MKYIKTYENLLPWQQTLLDFYPEVNKLFEFLKKFVKEMPSEFPNNTFYKSLQIEDNGKEKGWQTYSIILNTYYYFIFQFDYKSDGMWIKYTCDNKMENYLKKLENFFDAIAKEHNEWGWRFDGDEFMSEDINMYLNANKYNL